MTSSDHSVLPNLPEEVWSEVFSYLPDLDDRKSFRLTCHLLYRVCNHSRFQMNEKMVCYGNINYYTATRSLSNSCRKLGILDSTRCI